jgi:hypothetical protein
MRPPSPSPLPAGERDGVRGDSVDCNEIQCVCISKRNTILFGPFVDKNGDLNMEIGALLNGATHLTENHMQPSLSTGESLFQAPS